MPGESLLSRIHENLGLDSQSRFKARDISLNICLVNAFFQHRPVIKTLSFFVPHQKFGSCSSNGANADGNGRNRASPNTPSTTRRAQDSVAQSILFDPVCGIIAFTSSRALKPKLKKPRPNYEWTFRSRTRAHRGGGGDLILEGGL